MQQIGVVQLPISPVLRINSQTVSPLKQAILKSKDRIQRQVDNPIESRQLSAINFNFQKREAPKHIQQSQQSNRKRTVPGYIEQDTAKIYFPMLTSNIELKKTVRNYPLARAYESRECILNDKLLDQAPIKIEHLFQKSQSVFKASQTNYNQLHKRSQSVSIRNQSSYIRNQGNEQVNMLNKLDKLINICDKTQTNYNTIKRHMSLKDKYLHQRYQIVKEEINQESNKHRNNLLYDIRLEFNKQNSVLR